MKNIFSTELTEQVSQRIHNLTPISHAQWGTMSVDQMLAHLNVTYEMVYDDKHKKPNAFLRFILKKLVKNKVVSDKEFEKNGKTAPQFIINESKDFNIEKARLLHYLIRTQKLGALHFDGKESHSFGPLTVEEWHNLFYKHLDHHLNQFGV